MQLSIVFGYRNRDTLRVKRCLDSLSEQNFSDFEVVFVDYGSDENYRNEIEKLAKDYSFVNYVYNHTQGMPWNRSHALNTGVRYAKGDYILFGDIDLIYTPFVLSELLSKADDKTQMYSKVYFLDEKFDRWEQLNEINLQTFELSTERGRGGVHIVKKSILESINAYDEYYCFWGVEDRDLSGRIEQLGIETQWLDNENFPVFHQWHTDVSRAKKGFFPDRWWENMNIHFQLNINNPVRNDDNWGKLYTFDDRLVYRLSELNYDFSQTGDWMQKGKFAIELIDLLQLNPDKAVLCVVYKQQKIEKQLDFINKIIRKAVKSLVLTQDSERYFQCYKDIIYVIWTLIKETNIVADYSIVDKGDRMEIKLVGKKL
jgi:glycosyltransferase involved in cell wall biosynthesis